MMKVDVHLLILLLLGQELQDQKPNLLQLLELLLLRIQVHLLDVLQLDSAHFGPALNIAL